MAGKNGSNQISISTGTIIRFFLVALGFYLLWFLRDMVLIILTSIVVASFVESTLPRFRKLRMGRVFSVVLLYAISLLFLAAIFYLFAPLLITEIYNFSTFLSTYIPNSAIINYFQNDAFAGAKDIVTNLTHSLSLTTLLATSKAFITNLSGGFFQTLSAVFGNIFNVILIIIISFYLSVQENGIENFLKVIMPARYDDYAVDLWRRTRRKIGLWVKGQVMVAILVAILIYLVLSLLGMQYALLLAIIAGVMELIPYGILLALIPAVAFSYIDGGISSAFLVAGAYLIIHQFEIFLFTPLLINRVVGLSPLVIILSLLIGFEIGGFWGIILAIPGAVLAVEFLGDLEKHKIPKIESEK
ncbi:MAG TPA: AI-2E family transporter [Candidatus Paceibacterota bacterium]|jgi:predicted PurR-regulated permease PerM|nr:AI-2E family transporter [Candidatus Paceibacterota bacterium]